MTDIHAIDYNIGQKLREIRERRGLTLTEVGDKIGKSSSTISDYETGKTSMTLKTFVKICQVLHVDYLRLIAELEFEGKIIV